MRSLSLLLVLAFASASGAQPLTTDRPDFTESPLAVEEGRFQIETGTTYQVGPSGSAPTFNAPEALVRLGVLPFAELRLGLPDYIQTDEQNAVTGTRGRDGWGDPSIGLKLEIGQVAGVDLAFLPTTTIPVGERTQRDSEFGSSQFVPTFLLIAGTDLTERISLGTQGGITYNGPGGEDMDISGTLVLGYSLAEQIGAFAEVAVTDRTDVDARASVILHTGATLLLTDDLQLDAHVGAGVTDSAPDFLIGVGASARF